VLFQTDHDHRPAPGASQRRVPAPRHNLHHCAAPDDEPSTRVQAIRPSGLPLARDQRMDRQPFGFPPGFAPRDYSQRTPGRGRIIEHGPEICSTASAEPPTSRIYLMRATSRRTRGSGSLSSGWRHRSSAGRRAALAGKLSTSLRAGWVMRVRTALGKACYRLAPYGLDVCREVARGLAYGTPLPRCARFDD
jgi:hypothetical protein